jgi:hypothetical protein
VDDERRVLGKVQNVGKLVDAFLKVQTCQSK